MVEKIGHLTDASIFSYIRCNVVIEIVSNQLLFTDESKVNTMLSETDRNREMCNQIVRQVFPDPNQADHCPVGRSVSYLITPFCYSNFRTTRLNRLRRTHDCTKRGIVSFDDFNRHGRVKEFISKITC